MLSSTSVGRILELPDEGVPDWMLKESHDPLLPPRADKQVRTQFQTMHLSPKQFCPSEMETLSVGYEPETAQGRKGIRLGLRPTGTKRLITAMVRLSGGNASKTTTKNSTQPQTLLTRPHTKAQHRHDYACSRRMKLTLGRARSRCRGVQEQQFNTIGNGVVLCVLLY